MYSNTLCKYYILLVLLTGGWILSTVLSYPQSQIPSRQIVLRNGNQRTSRGFQLQNAKLSTARGFGKRAEQLRGIGGNEIFISSSLDLPSPSSSTLDDYTFSEKLLQSESTDSVYPPPRNLYAGNPKRLQSWILDELQSNSVGKNYEKGYFMEPLFGRPYGVPG